MIRTIKAKIVNAVAAPRAAARVSATRNKQE